MREREYVRFIVHKEVRVGGKARRELNVKAGWRL